MSLLVLSEKLLAHASELVAYCDPHDLIAIATDAHDIVVYRLNGHVAYTVKRKDSDLEVTALNWKQDGSVLAIGWSDGGYGLYSGENGKLLSSGSVRNEDVEADEDDAGGPVVKGFRWTIYQSPHQPKSELTKDTASLALDDSVDGESIGVPGKTQRDSRISIEQLTRSIATLDVTTILPRLSALPSHGVRAGPDGSRFTSQVATDAVFETAKEGVSDSIDILICLSSDSTVRVLMDDTVELGSCSISGVRVQQASHAKSSSHAILSRTEDEQLRLNILDLPLDTLGGSLLHVIATNTKRIQTLLSYTTQTVRCITHDYTTGLAFPSRLIANMQTELAEKDDGSDLTTELYHLAMTGTFTPTMLEWLVDIVKETNHKRWDAAVNAMYSHLQSHLFIHLKPALDRMSIATTTLRGYARYHEGSTTFEADPALFSRMLDGIDSLRIVSQALLLIVGTEQKQFKAFSKWLRVMIDIGVAGPGTKGATETEATENPNLEYPLILEYIERTMLQSRLGGHVEQRPAHVDIEGELCYERTCDAIGKLDALGASEVLQIKDVQNADALVSLPALTAYLEDSVKAALERVTQWQGKMLVSPISVALQYQSDVAADGMHGSKVLDMETRPGGSEGERTSDTRLLLLPAESREQVVVQRICGSLARDQLTESVDLQGEVLDAKFTTSGALFLCRDEDGSSRIIKPDGCLLYQFEGDAGFKPERLLVGGRVDKMVCLVLGNGGREWKALDMSNH